jgi:flagellar biosynthesis component FlhA
VIAFVNICGGLAIGILINDLEIAVALRRYTVLTIGDGLLSQIPSLLNSVAAGLIVTRVQADDSSTLAGDLLRQLGQFTVARSFVAVAAFVLGCLPGMPHVVLLVVSAALVASVWLPSSAPASPVEVAVKAFEPSLAESIQIEIHHAWVARLPSIQRVSQELEAVRHYAFNSWGLVLQRLGIGLWSNPQGTFRILVRGMEVFRSHAPIESDVWGEFTGEIRKLVDLYKVELIDDGATRRALDYVERQIPDLVNGVVPGVVSLTQMTGVMRALLREGITTRHLDVILQAIAEYGGKLSDRQVLAEVRAALAPVISASVADGNVIHGAVVEPVIDLVLGKAEESGTIVSGEIVDLICEQVERLMTKGLTLIASKRARAYLRDIVRVRWADIPVIAHEEIAPRFEFSTLGSIELKSDEQRRALVGAL